MYFKTLPTAGILLAWLLMLTTVTATAADKKIIFVAGPPSHGYGGHEHFAGCMLLAKCLREAIPSAETVVYKNRWPKDSNELDDASTIVLFANGGQGNPILPHLEKVEKLMAQGVGLTCLHYAVQVPKGQAGEKLKHWIGGHYELHWSVNPHWKAVFPSFPKHPVARGLKPFAIDDEWYYHMRFNQGMKNVTPILSAIPPDTTRRRPDGPHSGNPTVRSRMGMPEHVAWSCQRENGGRGFGFTGAHWHWNWANDNFRKVVLNGIAWTAGVEIPSGGIDSKTPTWDELEENQDYPTPDNFDRQPWLKRMKMWRTQSSG